MYDDDDDDDVQLLKPFEYPIIRGDEIFFFC